MLKKHKYKRMQKAYVINTSYNREMTGTNSTLKHQSNHYTVFGVTSGHTGTQAARPPLFPSRDNCPHQLLGYSGHSDTIQCITATTDKKQDSKWSSTHCS